MCLLAFLLVSLQLQLGQVQLQGTGAFIPHIPDIWPESGSKELVQDLNTAQVLSNTGLEVITQWATIEKFAM